MNLVIFPWYLYLGLNNYDDVKVVPLLAVFSFLSEIFRNFPLVHDRQTSKNALKIVQKRGGFYRNVSSTFLVSS